MGRRNIGLLQVAFLVVLALGLSVGSVSSSPPDPVIAADIIQLPRPFLLDEPGLSFPFQVPTDAIETHCYGLYPWSPQGERHGGIDIVPEYKSYFMKPIMRKFEIIAPANARVIRVVENTPGSGAPALMVLMEMNRFWYLSVNFEPQSTDRVVFQEQAKNVVRAGTQLKKGDPIGSLVVFKVLPDHYPHIHISLFYKHPLDTLDYLFEHSLEIVRSNGTNLPPMTGAGSPWDPQDLGIPTTFFCPYEYSSPLAKAVYRSLPKLNGHNEPCTSVCAYNSVDNDCGH